MPQTRNSAEPPPVMTWGKAAPALVLAVIFDAMRMFFEWFWLFGPATVALYCANKVGSAWVVGGLLEKGCAVGAAAIGISGGPVIEVFGTVMAIAVGLCGWLVIGGWLMATNERIFKENALWFAGSLLISETPFIGTLPAFTVAVWKMHSNQIKIETVALRKYEEENAVGQSQIRNQRARELSQAQDIQQAQADDAELAAADVY